MADLAIIVDHVEQAQGNFISQYRDKPRFNAKTAAIVVQLQEIENAIYDLWLSSWIDTAEDQQLDDIGDLVGQKRQGFIDEDYRPLIKARIKTNRSDGQIEQMNEILNLILGDATDSGTREFYPAALVAETYSVPISPSFIWRDFLKRAKGGGVWFGYQATRQPRGNVLMPTWSAGTDTSTTSQRPGWSGHTPIGGGECLKTYR
jgi:hypothetical protein